MAGNPRWCQHIRLDVAPDLCTTSSPEQTVEALHELLGYIFRRASAGTITVRGGHDAEWAVLWVQDRAAPMSRRRRGVVVDAVGWCSPGVDDLPLHVAAHLVRGEGGELRIEDRTGGGGSFGTFLPTAAPP